jgi:hypothetical protein
VNINGHADIPAVHLGGVKIVSGGKEGLANLSLPFWLGACHKKRMDKHSRAFGQPGKGKRRRLSTLKGKPRSETQDTPDQLVELATDAIRDGQTTVAMFLAPFHPDLRFRAFRAYTAAVSAFMAKWRRLNPSARPPGRRRTAGSRKLG